jgi:hypothetical protein
MLPKLGEDFVEVGLQDFGVVSLERQPLVRDLSPEDLDAVEFGAVGQQEDRVSPFYLSISIMGLIALAVFKEALSTMTVSVQAPVLGGVCVIRPHRQRRGSALLTGPAP